MLPPTLTVIGVSHRSASVADREALTFDRERTEQVLGDLKGLFPDVEAMLLSTCNRTELVMAAPPDSPVMQAWHLVIHGSAGDVPCGGEGTVRYRLDGAAAVEHLFRVASGLDSAILGDVEILGQLRDAHATAAAAGTVGKVLDRTIRSALAVGKSARHRTDISVGGAGIGSAAASVVAQRGVERTLVVGAGAAAEAVVTQLGKRADTEITICNRTRERAEQIAARRGARVADMSRLTFELARHDVVVVATAAPDVIVTHDMLEALVQAGAAPGLVIDAGMPRNVAGHPGVQVLTLDDLREAHESVEEQRRSAVPAVESLVADALAEWRQWHDGLSFEDVIADLYRDVASLSDDLGELLGDGAQEITRRVKAMLHGHVTRLREQQTSH